MGLKHVLGGIHSRYRFPVQFNPPYPRALINTDTVFSFCSTKKIISVYFTLNPAAESTDHNNSELMVDQLVNKLTEVSLS